MKVSDYQEQAARTLKDELGFELTEEETLLVWHALALAGEAGEVAELVKKGVFYQRGVDTEHLKEELGDVIWETAAICTGKGLDMQEIVQNNVYKLQIRHPEGFDANYTKSTTTEKSEKKPKSKTKRKKKGWW